MRQIFTLRFWLALIALGGITAGLWLVLRDDIAEPDSVPIAAEQIHRVDIVALVYVVRADANFGMADGTTQGEIRLLIDGTRTMIIPAGTPGEISCTELAEVGACAVAADLLGESVLWFSLFAAAPRATVALPAPRQLRGGGWLLLDNGWEVRHAGVVERSCPDDTESLPAFIERFDDRATSTFDLEQQQVVKVTCRTS